jgi:hypothetical protein
LLPAAADDFSIAALTSDQIVIFDQAPYIVDGIVKRHRDLGAAEQDLPFRACFHSPGKQSSLMAMVDQKYSRRPGNQHKAELCALQMRPTGQEAVFSGTETASRGLLKGHYKHAADLFGRAAA